MRIGFVIVALLSPILAAALLLLCPSVAEGDDNRLSLDPYVCDGDTITMATCLERQIAGADRWSAAVLASYRRFAAVATADAQQGGSQPVDQQALLTSSEHAFAHYRVAFTQAVKGVGYAGSGSKIEAARAEFRLIVDHTQALLRACGSRKAHDLGEVVDLSISDWCE
ncbi:MAG: hypothetical protein HYU58_01400 [Proteobacteria bacterium]|nr:hypothetical protein [Pseudomonadota bacterium]